MPDNDKSDFNAAVAFLQDLRYNWRMAMIASQEYDAVSWYNALLFLSRRFYPDMKPDEIEICEKFKDDLQPMVMKTTNDNYKKGITRIKPELFNKLQKFEEYLGQIEKRCGYRTKYGSDPRYSI